MDNIVTFTDYRFVIGQYQWLPSILIIIEVFNTNTLHFINTVITLNINVTIIDIFFIISMLTSIIGHCRNTDIFVSPIITASISISLIINNIFFQLTDTTIRSLPPSVEYRHWTIGRFINHRNKSSVGRSISFSTTASLDIVDSHVTGIE
jgi:hypothetical protein